MNTVADLRSRAGRVVRELARLYPDARCSLDYDTPFQLLVATILSAQCTDARVNKVTPALFARYPDPPSMASAELDELERLIQTTGFYHNKAKNLLACAKQLLERHGGEVPASMGDLVRLAGVGRKTANVLLGNAFGVPGLPVDTHVARLSQRLGLTAHTQPEKIEEEVCGLVAKKEWARFGLRLIYHGRQVCDARKPRCDDCTLARLCPRVGLDKSEKSTEAAGGARPLDGREDRGRRERA
jgi:endonuclease III